MDIQITNFLKLLEAVFDDNKEILLDEPADWEFLSKTARKQNLLPLFFEAASLTEDYRKSSVYAKDQQDTFSMVAEQIQRSSAFTEIYGKIAAQGIYPIVLKGIVCRQLYGELGDLRPSSDEDILVEVKDIQKVREILEQEGYMCRFPEMTEQELSRAHEVSFYSQEQKLGVDVHTSIIGKQNEERVVMNSLFQEVHEHGQNIQVYGTDVKAMEPTESLLFLILHAYKHFQNSGVGIRQVIDILLYYREYKETISEEILREALKTCRAESFWLDILYIGNHYLGLYEEKTERFCCPEELLQDMMREGVFGGRKRTDGWAAGVNLAVRGDVHRHNRLYVLFKAAFPSKQLLMTWYLCLQEKPWLLPAVWVWRWIKFLRYAGKDVRKITSEILQKSYARLELIEKYRE